MFLDKRFFSIIQSQLLKGRYCQRKLLYLHKNSRLNYHNARVTSRYICTLHSIFSFKHWLKCNASNYVCTKGTINWFGQLFENYTSNLDFKASFSKMKVIYILFWQKNESGPQFGRLFHKLVWSPWLWGLQEICESRLRKNGLEQDDQVSLWKKWPTCSPTHFLSELIHKSA
jgi:hypothetical protein